MESLHIRQIRSKNADPRDQLIAELHAQLKAERETRETLQWVIRNGVDSVEVLEAITGDPIPAEAVESVDFKTRDSVLGWRGY